MPIEPKKASSKDAGGAAFASTALSLDPACGEAGDDLPLEDQDVPLIPFGDWAPHEATIANTAAEFVRQHS